MKDNSPSFSIIIPNYRDIRISRCIQSIARQTYKNYELIVVDGQSDSRDVYDIYRNSKIDKLIVEQDHGIFDAINKGVLLSQGDIILLVGSDDYLLEDSLLESVSRQFEVRPELDIVGVQCIFVNGDGKIVREWRYDRISTRRILSGDLPPHFSLFIRKKIYDEVGLFKQDGKNSLAEDSIWLVRMARMHSSLRTAVIQNCHIVMETGGTSTRSFRNIIIQNHKLYRYLRKENVRWPIVFVARKLLIKVTQVRLISKRVQYASDRFVRDHVAGN